MTDTTETHKAIRKALAGVEAAKTPQQFDIAEVAFQRIKFPMLVALLADRDRLAAEVEGWKRTNEAEDEAYTALLAEADALKAEVEALTKAREPAQVAPEFQEEVDRMSREAVTLWQAANLDAKRYRWLRTWTVGVRNSQRQSFSLPDLHPVGNIMKGSVAQHFDAAIDAQIAAPPSPGTPVREGGE